MQAAAAILNKRIGHLELLKTQAEDAIKEAERVISACRMDIHLHGEEIAQLKKACAQITLNHQEVQS